MEALQNKIDFAVILTVKNANPNGDPLNGNRPRSNYDGFGEISDVCIKRKIRNRLQDEGFDIYVQSNDNRKDEYPSLKARLDGEIGKAADAKKDEAKFRKLVCERWIDVRSFGQVFAFGGEDKGVSVGIRGPVSIHPAFSVHTVSTTSTQITKSVSSEGDGSKRGSDTMGMKHRIDFGIYTFYGSINPQLAEKTGFSEKDAEAIKTALKSLFENDASSARPEGSMEIQKVYWWRHSCKIGQHSSAKVHHSLHIDLLSNEPKSLEDIRVTVESLDGLEPEILEGR